MSKLALIYDRQFQNHLNPDSHPESPERLSALERQFYRHGLTSQVEKIEPRPASNTELSMVHSQAYVDELSSLSLSAADTGLIRPTSDTNTWVSAGSFETARLAAGAGLVAAALVLAKKFSSSFVAVRPPGHHALFDRAYGYCLFNNVAVTARHAQQNLGVNRILIIDWDVHHGNGTQDLFYNDPSICFISIHQYPLWPTDTGWLTEDGEKEGKGYNINVPLPPGTGDAGYLKVWDQLVDPVAREFKPALILVSAGYDAHLRDPLGQQRVTTAGYYLLSSRLAELSEQLGAPVVCFLEGGYNTRAMSEAAITTMSVLNAGSSASLNLLNTFTQRYGGEVTAETADRNEHLVLQRMEAVKKHFSRFWKCFRIRP